MKQKILKLTSEELIRAIQSIKQTQLELLVDVELIDIKYDAFTRQVFAVIRSDAFENVAEGASTPEFIIESSSNPLSLSAISTTVNTSNSRSHSSAVSQKSLIQTLTAQNQQGLTTNVGAGVKTLESKSEVNMDTCGFEGEFTKEQRKLLKFTSQGDYVIVKPIQFLKTEWEDINDIVKSIGGKWVKGTTIDHWAIPKNHGREE
jgi:hypothetical protein